MEGLDTLEQCEKTPLKKKRLPRELSGTKLAEERKKKLAALRQKRRRAKVKAQREREQLGRGDSSDEEALEETEEPATNVPEDVDPIAAECGDELGENPALEYPDVHVIDEAARRRTVDEELQAWRLARQASTDEDLEAVASEFARIKVTSCVSDSAVNKLFKMFVRRNEAIMRLINNGDIRDSYTNSIRPLLVSRLIPIYSSLLLKEEDAARGHLYRKVEGLQVIPAEYFNLPADGSTQLLRTEEYVRLADIKKLFLETHGDTAASRRMLKNCSLSVDGVKESNKGSRSFIIVTLRIGCCMYLVRVFNPLIGVADSKPTPKEILMYSLTTTICQWIVVISSLSFQRRCQGTGSRQGNAGHHSDMRHGGEALPPRHERHQRPVRLRGVQEGRPDARRRPVAIPSVYTGGGKVPGGVHTFCKVSLAFYQWFVSSALFTSHYRVDVLRNTRKLTKKEEKRERDKRKGIIADSALYDFPDLDFIWGLPLDVFHLAFEGITKLMLVRMFVTKTNKEARELLEILSYYYQKMKVFSETARKTRKLSVKQLKGNELAVITFSVFPLLALNLLKDKKEPVW